MTEDNKKIFGRLRGILTKYAQSLSVSEDSAERYCLEAPVGPATVRSWGGKKKRQTIPVAWVQAGKAYVSFHLMGIYGELEGMSPELDARMQGKACFNFKVADETLFQHTFPPPGVYGAAAKNG